MRSLINAVALLASGDSEVYFIAFTSLWFAVTSVAVATVFSIPLGFLIGYKSFRGKKAVVVVLNSLMAVPTVAIGLFVYSLVSKL